MTQIEDAVKAERSRWLAWLVKNHYGIDHSALGDPPCSLSELSTAYAEILSDQGEDSATWAWCIRQETNMFAKKDQ